MPIPIEHFPTINASLNALALVFLVLGFFAIRRQNVRAHATFMICAVAASALFLGCYLYYHYHALHTPFPGEGWVRPVYFFVLITHVILAAVVPFFVIALLWRAAKRRFREHARLARVAFPVWVYVSITGVIVYLMLYRVEY